MTDIIILILSAAATTVGAISGIGGGILIRPALDVWTDWGTNTISFLSSCMVLTMAAVTLLKKKGGGGLRLDGRRGTLLAFGAVAGGFLGKWLFEALIRASGQEALVGAAQSAAILALVVVVISYTLLKGRLVPKSVQNSALCMLIGIALGAVSAFLGIGGGPLNLLVLSFLFAMETKTAVLHSIYIIFFAHAAALVNVLASQTVPNFAAATLAVMMLGGVCGGYAGSAVSRRLTNRGVDRIFIGVLLVVGVLCAYNIYLFMGYWPAIRPVFP